MKVKISTKLMILYCLEILIEIPKGFRSSKTPQLTLSPDLVTTQ